MAGLDCPLILHLLSPAQLQSLQDMGKQASITAGYSGDSSCVPKLPREHGNTHHPPNLVMSEDAGPHVPCRLPGAAVLDELWPALHSSAKGHETSIKAASIPLQLCSVHSQTTSSHTSLLFTNLPPSPVARPQWPDHRSSAGVLCHPHALNTFPA